MNYTEILKFPFSEPAAVLSYRNGELKLLGINDKYLPELWMNIDEADFMKSSIHDSFDDENLYVFTAAVRKCVETGEEQTCETWRSLVSNCCGSDRICLKSRITLLEKNSEEAIVYDTVRNITTERRTQDTLADIEHRYKAASEQINIYNWEYNIATKEMRPCYRCMRDLGLPAVVTNYPEPAIDMGIFPPDYAEMYRDMMHKIDTGAKELEADIPLTVGRVPFRVKYTTEFDEAGNPVKAFGSATLISAAELGHIRLDNQIIATLAEEYCSLYMMDFINDNVNIIKDGDIIAVGENDSCGELAVNAAEKISDLTDEQRKAFGDVDKLRHEIFKDCDRREFVYKDEAQNRWIRIVYHVIERGIDTVDRLLISASVVDDYRAQKMDADRLIAAQKAELEDRQKMLLDAIDEANKANRAKTEFFSNMSHDIRTPMNAITGFSKLALEEIDNKAHLEEFLKKIIAAGDHLLNLINDILDMSRIESGKMELSPAPVCVKDLLNECADMIRVRTEEKNIELNVDIEAVGDDIVNCDKMRFRQIMLNLLSNAYKFTPEGGRISVSGRLKERSDDLTYEIRVKDTGIGMSEEFSKHIWDAFSREKTEKVNEIQGTGLGMAIVRSIVNLMQGTIELKTAPGEGSEFIIIVPLEPAEAVSEETARDKAITEAMNKRYEGKTLLVVDDSEVNIVLATFVLAKHGFEIKKTNSGVDAIELIKNSQPGDIDLILMDVSMPVMDGLEATRRIRALENKELAGIPIIAMTANAFASDIQDALDAGMNAHVPKPFREEELIVKINDNL